MARSYKKIKKWVKAKVSISSTATLNSAVRIEFSTSSTTSIRSVNTGIYSRLTLSRSLPSKSMQTRELAKRFVSIVINIIYISILSDWKPLQSYANVGPTTQCNMRNIYKIGLVIIWKPILTCIAWTTGDRLCRLFKHRSPALLNLPSFHSSNCVIEIKQYGNYFKFVLRESTHEKEREGDCIQK